MKKRVSGQKMDYLLKMNIDPSNKFCMKQILFSFILLVTWCFKVNSAQVTVILSGLNDGDEAQLVISSETYLSTISVASNGSFTFEDVSSGIHYVKAECMGYECSPAQTVVVNEKGTISPNQDIKLVLTPISSSENEWNFLWQEDGSPAGYTHTSHINRPPEIEYLGKKIVPANVPSYAIL